MSKFKRLLGIFFPMVLCVLLCGCQALFPGEHTELIKDGKYKPFEDPKKNIEKLMELVEAEDWPQNVTIEPNPMETLMQLTTEGNADSIYEMFSLTPLQQREMTGDYKKKQQNC